MMALSIQQPWADLIVYGHKNIENRGWRPVDGRLLGQRIAIHTGKTYDSMAASRLLHPDCDLLAYKGDRLEREEIVELARKRVGGIVGSARLVNFVTSGAHPSLFNPWFEGPYGFVFDKPFALEEVLPYRGKLNFFWVSWGD